MNNVKYTDENGEVVLAVSSSIPGLIIVPPDMTAEDGEVITHHEFKQIVAKHIEKNSEHNPNSLPTLDSLTNAVAQLQAEIKTLKDQKLNL